MYKLYDLVSVRPSYVSTKAIGNIEVGGVVITPDDCAKAVLEKLGHDEWTNGHWRHALMAFYNSIVLDPILQKQMFKTR